MNIRGDFPFLKDHLIYFDNAATSQKPQQVIDAISHYYAYQNAPVHRGVYKRAEDITRLYENARAMVASFIGADAHEIVFTSGTTEGINFIASTWARDHIARGNEIIVTELEHHANIVPWQRVARETGAVIRYVPILADGSLDYDAYERMLSPRTKLVACTHCSNALGTLVDADRVIQMAHKVGAKVLLDAAQTVGHQRIAAHALNPDFLVFSAHKMLGPTGIGVLYIAERMHPEVQPYQVGGGMVFSVSCQDASWLKPPHCYEAGTPPIAQAIGLAAAIAYLEHHVDYAELKKHEAALCSRLIDGLITIPGATVLGPQDQLKTSGHMVSFTLSDHHPHDVVSYLDTCNIAVRAGNHCAQPLFTRLGLYGSIRASFYLYNTVHEVDRLLDALRQLPR